jgi:hypothetical protein
MMYFCTLFDSNYASKGIALYLSIERQTDDFVLYVMGMDRKCQEILNNCGFRHMVVECIDDAFSPELATAQSNRSRAEFCWTCGAYFTDYFLHKYDLPEIAYLDSDLMFFSSPKIVFDELKEKNASVGLAPHFTKYPLFGKYCVQFVYFKNDKDGSGCLRWWRDECLKWCYCKMEDGKYADQKYLDYFAGRFNNVCAIDNRGVGIAFWNMDYYRIKNGLIRYKKEKWPVVFFHYSGFSVSVDKSVLTMRHTMYLPKSIRDGIVDPYTALLRETYTRYMQTPISSVIIIPVSTFRNYLKWLAYLSRKILPVEWAIATVMRIKYKEKRVPYNEPNKQ